MRQLFVAPLTFLVPAVGKILVFFRVRSSRLVPGRAAARYGEVYRHGDLHLLLTLGSLVRSLRSRRDCHHKNALSHREWALPYSTPNMPPGIVREALSGCTETGAAPSRTSKDWASVSITVSPVRSLAAASSRDLPPVDTRRRHRSELCDASGAERGMLTTERCSFV